MRRDAPAARCEGLVRIYPSPSGEVHALKGVDVVVPAGRLTAVTGPSGSGKSSLLRILAAQDRPTAGVAEVAGTSLTGLSARRLRALRRREIGYVFPRPGQNLLPHLTGTEHLVLAGRLRGIGRRDAARQGAELLDVLGLADRAGHLPAELSGGEQQRLALAQAVLGRPALVVADEPTSELDSATTEQLLAAVAELTRDGTSVVMATHDPQAAAAADRVVHLRSGAVAHEEVAGRRLAVVDGEGRVPLPEEALARFPDRRVAVELTAHGVLLREP
ncbi:ABC transporter ATP-binding protein [Geodermatophilus sp. FMUSA9-8]|uniref:ABC transporter ATP-binding protein n=1 Tax=Geodermatophilus sp. FMUSA9-8 TaxID=3120155 RepID=UPI00300B49E6